MGCWPRPRAGGAAIATPSAVELGGGLALVAALVAVGRPKEKSSEAAPAAAGRAPKVRVRVKLRQAGSASPLGVTVIPRAPERW